MKALRFCLLLASISLIAVGLWLGEAGNTMMNAVMICLSCIGVG